MKYYTDYFAGVRNLADLRTRYKALARKFHPDNGGDEEIMKIINSQYDVLFKRFKAAAKAAAPKNEAPDKKARREREYSETEDQKIREMIIKLSRIKGIGIEIIGSWIWVDGDTYAVHDTLKALGLRWSKSRRKWHWNSSGPAGWRRGSRKSFAELRTKYGNTVVREKEDADNK